MQRIAWIVVFVASAAALAQDAAPAATKLLPSDAKRLVGEAVGGDPARAAAARKTLEATRPEDRKFILDALRALPFTPPKGQKLPADRNIRDTLEVAESPLKKANYIITLPKGYDGKKPLPVLFRFHGSGDTAAAFAKNTIEAKQPFICVTPEIPSEDRQGWNQPGGYQLVDRLFHHVLQDFNADPDHIYLSGHSAGGGASYMFSQLWPHRVAAFYVMARLYWAFHLAPEPCMDTVRNIPGYFVVGLKDTDERVSGFRTVEAYYTKNKLPGVFNFVPNKGHDYMQEFHQKAYDYMSKAARVAAPKEIRGIFFIYGNQLDVEPITSRRWWLEAKHGGYDGGAGTPFHAKVDGNVIDIDAPNLRAGSVLLTDGLVDLDQPVTIKLNGKEVHQGAVERSVSFLLDWFIQERDRGQLYWNRVSFGG